MSLRTLASFALAIFLGLIAVLLVRGVLNSQKTALTTTRANGDTLMYDPASGLFAVARKDGAPRTVFKPDDGKAYWRAQQGQAKSSSSNARREAGGDSDS